MIFHLGRIILASAWLVGFHPFFAYSQTIAEKKAGLSGGASELSPEMQKFLVEINKELRELKEKLRSYQGEAGDLYARGAPPESFHGLLLKINDVKEHIHLLQESWREMAATLAVQEGGYALWHQPDTTLEQLVIDYGSSDYVYLIPPEIGRIELSISSNIPIPQSSWEQMLEQILLQNGVGIQSLNPFLRTLYLVKEDLSTIRLITADPCDLEAYPGNTRVSFVLAPEPTDVRRIWYFLEKFVNSSTTVMQRIGRVILIVGEVSAIKDLLKIYDFVASNKRDLEYKAVPLRRVDAEEMAKILSTVFEGLQEEVDQEATAAGNGKEAARPRAQPPAMGGASRAMNSLNVIALPKVAQAVFLVGTREEIQKAENMILEVERQIGEARDRSIFSYHIRHSDPEEIAQILEKIYLLMVQNQIVFDNLTGEVDVERRLQEIHEKGDRIDHQLDRIEREASLSAIQPTFFAPPFYQQGTYVVNPRPIGSRPPEARDVNRGRDNFIVDPKTGLLVMVVETDLIPKLKEILKKLDVPKKMVQIEVMLFERAQVRHNNYGLNLLKLGDVASGKDLSGSVFHGDGFGSGVGRCLIPDYVACVGRGIFEFFYSSKNVPIDFAYKFMMTQDNVSLNASPSVVTMNQTEAVIAIKDERSILVGTIFPESNAAIGAQNAYTRAQYGIQINVTPTIHMADLDDPFSDPINYITLSSQINFDTFPPGQENSQQPRVNRREIVNEVRIPDGQTVIIGGLRRKQMEDSVERIPFLGEIPGLGKLFSHTSLKDEDTELIIFMTPKIISDPSEDFYRLRKEYLCKRPGDLPAFLCRLNEALDREKERALQGFMTMIFGRPRPRYICEEVEYDGR